MAFLTYIPEGFFEVLETSPEGLICDQVDRRLAKETLKSWMPEYAKVIRKGELGI